MAAITLKDVRKSYAGNQVIHGVDVEIADGEFIVIVGPSGCGKSTLLRMVAGLEVISAGQISIGGRVVNDLEPKDRDIAMVFQNYALYPHMSAYDNMAYGLKIAGKSKAEIDERVARAAKMLELADYLQRKPRQLSGGQRQRVAMGRAIVRDPAAFLFDEPLSNLDAKLRVQMRLEIKKLQNALKTTSLYVTHDQMEAMTLADRLIVMNGGVAEQVDTPLAIYARPATIFVAGFIGSPAMNFLPGTVGEGGRTLSLAGGDSLALGDAGVAAGSRLTAGIRPEHLTVCTAGEPDLTLTVDVVEALGADTLAHGRVGGGDVTVRLPGQVPAAAGQTIALTIAPGTLHLFDTATGKRAGTL